MMRKVMCKICGKVGNADSPDGLIRHLRLAHNMRNGKYCEYYMLLDEDVDIPIDIFPCSRKEYAKRLNNEFNKKAKIERNKELDRKYGKLQHKSIHWGTVLTSAFETKKR